MPPVIIAAGIGAAATGIGAAVSSSATKKASDAATQAAAANTQLQTDIYNKNTALIQPTVDQGKVAAERENALLGLSGDPEAAAKAFADWRGSTGYDFALNEGLNAITSSSATRGMLDSGATLKAITRFGQGVADQSFASYLGNIDNIAGRGVNAIGSLTGTGQTYANAVSTNNTNAAGAVGTAALTNASSINALLNSFVGGLGANRGQSSYDKAQAPAINAMTFSVPGQTPAFPTSKLAF